MISKVTNNNQHQIFGDVISIRLQDRWILKIVFIFTFGRFMPNFSKGLDLKLNMRELFYFFSKVSRFLRIKLRAFEIEVQFQGMNGIPMNWL